MAQPRGRSFELERVPIFEKFDRFCVRLRKLMDMFRTVKQFMTLIEVFPTLFGGAFFLVDEPCCVAFSSSRVGFVASCRPLRSHSSVASMK